MKRIHAYRLAVFLSAFLLFQAQPMVSKALLPSFGGSYLMWGACMVFFQGVLLLGYLYAHAVQRSLGVARYARFHWILLAAPLVCFPFHFDALGSAPAAGPMVLAVVRSLALAVGLPLFTLSTTSLVLQRWLAESDLPEASNPYVLYSASNLGSMIGLLSYPVMVEPLFDLRVQGYLWWGGYVALVAAHAPILPRHVSAAARAAGKAEERSEAKGTAVVAWVLLSAAACAMLLAVTNLITFDIASLPLLWILPLSVYLLCFVLAFRRVTWWPAWTRGALHWAVLLGMLLYLMTQLRLELPAWAAAPLHLIVLFVVVLNCCGRLAGMRPADPSRLTGFYLAVAAGGLAGSTLVSWILPAVTRSLAEVPLAFCLALTALAVAGGPRETRDVARQVKSAMLPLVAAACAVTAIPWAAARLGAGLEGGAPLVMAACALPLALAMRAAARAPWRAAAVALGAAVALNWTEELAAGMRGSFRLRNYYGVYRVFDRGNLRYLQHGTTQHGREYTSGPKVGIPLAYFHPTTPAARVLLSPRWSAGRVGMIGLGTGALAAYARQGQEFTIYELDPDNLPIARDRFTYLRTAEQHGARLRFVLGDGRLSLSREPAGRFDVFIVDAFNSGSIPVHLLTVEALREYLRVLTPGGVLLLHVSNKMLRLEPAVFSGAEAAGATALRKSNGDARDPDAEQTVWMAVTRRADVRAWLEHEMGWRAAPRGSRLPRPWTDRYSNVLGAALVRATP